jgi:hypothetical protein
LNYIDKIFHNFVDPSGLSYEIFCLIIGILAFLVPISLQIMMSLNKDYYSSGLAKHFYSEKLFSRVIHISIEQFQVFLLIFISYLFLPKFLLNMNLPSIIEPCLCSGIELLYILILLFLLVVLILSTINFLKYIKEYSISKINLLNKFEKEIQDIIHD